MGEVVFFAAYRPGDPAEPAPRAAPGGAHNIQNSCKDFASGLDRMKMAARMLSEASSELCELARER